MRKNPRRILSPQRLPFRHPGSGTYKSNGEKDALQLCCVTSDRLLIGFKGDTDYKSGPLRRLAESTD
jgi:hypothetical protein